VIVGVRPRQFGRPSFQPRPGLPVAVPRKVSVPAIFLSGVNTGFLEATDFEISRRRMGGAEDYPF
jgi:hypothetical protein